jgi:hypothetical protein
MIDISSFVKVTLFFQKLRLPETEARTLVPLSSANRDRKIRLMLLRSMECGMETTYSVELHFMIREVYSITRLLNLNARNNPV